ncbi:MULTISPECIES: topoisomerase DNA-binding C4 zinc finger domain-containing protein [Paenibacillus]|uniref:topoisomerase DNA-binding C4 zinc finger domain-containing protein n=1 Tax=Paenibacillus TaxID=44249 RepID=UPI0022B8F97B|nr:topoisomerase DNA-binding C4 zinc finger domain-containing protein [Paenibacillus caseinilyticus]MCZ8519756.1 topoisomerase DNA-binding C4 zinc finger domain-containing protein [Paenibacillus caseinilyticus]
MSNELSGIMNYMVFQPMLFVGLIMVLYFLIGIGIQYKLLRRIPEKIVTVIGLIGAYFVFTGCMERYQDITDLVARKSEVNWILGAVAFAVLISLLGMIFQKQAITKDKPRVTSPSIPTLKVTEVRQQPESGAEESGQEHRTTVTCRCGADMVPRKSRDGKSFLGCSTFPRCRHTESVHEA